MHRKVKRNSVSALRTSVKREMALPRMARSARIAVMKLDTSRTPEQPSATVPGKVDKIIPSRTPSKPEKAQIAVEGADRQKQDFRIENSLTDEYGDDVKLKKGAHVDVTVTED
jgi:hypothetical protein